MSEAAVTTETHDETSVSALWETARWFMRWLIALCGRPCALVADAYLSPKERREILFWLRPVEALIRRLLVAEAARIAKTLAPATANASGKDQRRARPSFRPVTFPDVHDSTGWAVRFSILGQAVRTRPSAAIVPDVHGPRLRVLGNEADVLAPARLALAAAQHRLRHAQNGPESDCEERETRRLKPSRAAGNPWPLARRIEAAIRVLVNPQAYARRLARRLRTDAARLARACRPPPPRLPGERPPYGDAPLRRASEHALRRLSGINNQWSEGMVRGPSTGCACGTCGGTPRHVQESPLIPDP